MFLLPGKGRADDIMVDKDEPRWRSIRVAISVESRIFVGKKMVPLALTARSFCDPCWKRFRESKGRKVGLLNSCAKKFDVWALGPMGLLHAIKAHDSTSVQHIEIFIECYIL
jgi:hypothetical protein